MQKHHVCQLYEFCLLNFHLTFFRRYSNVKWANIYRFRIHWILYSLLRGSLHKLKIIHELGYCIFARLNAKFWLPKHSLENQNHCDDSSEIAFEKRTDISIELLDSCMVSCQLSRNVFSFLGIQQINFMPNHVHFFFLITLKRIYSTIVFEWDKCQAICVSFAWYRGIFYCKCIRHIFKWKENLKFEMPTIDGEGGKEVYRKGERGGWLMEKEHEKRKWCETEQ